MNKKAYKLKIEKNKYSRGYLTHQTCIYDDLNFIQYSKVYKFKFYNKNEPRTNNPKQDRLILKQLYWQIQKGLILSTLQLS